jgi:methylase of polypeptide subunit release factors
MRSDAGSPRTPRRYARVDQRKARGATYTPRVLADFVAAKMLGVHERERAADRLRILDPACGDGELLLALLRALPDESRRAARVVAFDNDPRAIEAAAARLHAEFPGVDIRIDACDFLERVLDERAHAEPMLEQRVTRERVLANGAELAASLGERFDLVIANPPYVRTQILGSRAARSLALTFGITGRIDLCFAFVAAIARVLAPRGVAGIIVSNRFMTTRAGSAVRRQLLERFDLRHVWDLGDTRLFDAAVLPAVLLACARAEREPRTGPEREPRTGPEREQCTGPEREQCTGPEREQCTGPEREQHIGAEREQCTGAAREQHVEAVRSSERPRFSSVYSSDDPPTTRAEDALRALDHESGSIVAVTDAHRYRVLHGALDRGDSADGVWRISSPDVDAWLSRVDAHTSLCFADLGRVRVGVKTAADDVFIRSDWDAMPASDRPELLRPLTTRESARRFKAIEPDVRHQILYPHEMTAALRTPCDLRLHPKSARYLEAHRSELEARRYVIDAGRRWYEIWVPQDPASWSEPKLVFLDIAEHPTFWIDVHGTVVGGACYWLRCENGADPELLWLALAVANSTFIAAFYDRSFHNKLYAGRRRFMTQYVQRFPLPDPRSNAARELCASAKRIYAATPSDEADALALELDELVWRAFGFDAAARALSR